MRHTLLRLLSDDERNMLYDVMEDEEEDSSYRAKIILLKDKEHTVPEIKIATNHHDVNIRKRIHRFNEKGIEGITSKLHKHKPLKLSVEIEKKIIEITSKNPREGYGLPFSTYFLRVLVGVYVSNELNLVDSISHTKIRNILLKYGIKYHQQSKVTLGSSTDPQYDLKKKRIEELRYRLPVDSVLLYVDKLKKDQSIVAKTYGGISWSSITIQSKVSQTQKIKSIQNVLGVYDHYK